MSEASRLALLGVLALVVGALFAHRDLDVVLWLGTFTAVDFNVYRAVATHAPDALPMLAYGPVVYWLFGAWIELGRWLFELFPLAGWGGPKVLAATDYLWASLLYLPFHALALWGGLRILRALGAAADGAALRWYLLTQPIPLFISFAMGQLDIVPTALVLAGAAWLLEGTLLPAALVMALATLTKNWPAALFFGWILWTVLFHPQPGMRRRALIAVALFVLAIVLPLAAVWGEPLRDSYLALRFQGYVFSHLDLPWMPLNFYAYAGVALLVALALLPRLRAALRALLGDASARVRERSLPLAAWREGLVWATLLFFALLFFNRVWMPQYLVWVAPWIALLVVWRGERRWRLALLLGNLLYLLVVPVYWSGNVDSNLFHLASAQTTLGVLIAGWLGDPRPVWVWMLFSAFFVVLGATAAAAIVRGLAAPPPAVGARPLARLRGAGDLQLALLVAIAAAHAAVALGALG